MSERPTWSERPSLSEVDQRDTEQLNLILRVELAAVESYTRCLESLQNESLREPLRSIRMSHQRRVKVLEERIERLGAEAVSSAGLWGGVARAIGSTLSLVGANAALAALRQGERQGESEYRRSLAKLSPIQRRFVEVQLIPEQARSYELIQKAGSD